MGWINVTISEQHSTHGFEKKVRHSIDFDRLYIRTWKEERTTEELVDSRKTRSHSRMKRFVMEFWLATNEERGNARHDARSAVFVVSCSFYPSSFILVRVSSFGIVQLDKYVTRSTCDCSQNSRSRIDFNQRENACQFAFT